MPVVAFFYSLLHNFVHVTGIKLFLRWLIWTLLLLREEVVPCLLISISVAIKTEPIFFIVIVACHLVHGGCELFDCY